MWIFKRLVDEFHQQKFLFASQFIWWLADLLVTKPLLIYCINIHGFPSKVNYWEISTLPKYIQQESFSLKLETDNNSIINWDCIIYAVKGTKKVNVRPIDKQSDS